MYGVRELILVYGVTLELYNHHDADRFVVVFDRVGVVFDRFGAGFNCFRAVFDRFDVDVRSNDITTEF